MNTNQKLAKAISDLIPEAKLHNGFEQDLNAVRELWIEPELRHVLWGLSCRQLVPQITAIGINAEIKMLNMPSQVKDARVLWQLRHNLYGQSPELKGWLLNLLTS